MEQVKFITKIIAFILYMVWIVSALVEQTKGNKIEAIYNIGWAILMYMAVINQ